ncbi:MAG: hypothetical protein M0R03_19780 [Novosphingobium sp.]|nr:hypothetical protein [Novosphingobium sp.]
MGKLRKYQAFANALVASFMMQGRSGVKDTYKTHCLNEDANVNAVIGFIIMAAVMAIGIPVLYSITSSTPAIPESNPLNATQSNLLTTITSGYGLLVVSLIVVAMVVIVGLLMAFGGRKQ